MDPIAVMLGIDFTDPREQLAEELIRNDRTLLEQLIARRRATMTQDELAHLLGVTQSAISQFENGDRDPRLSTIRAYALAIGARIVHSIDPQGAAPSRASRVRHFATQAKLVQAPAGAALHRHEEEAENDRSMRFDGVAVEVAGKVTRIAHGR